MKNVSPQIMATHDWEVKRVLDHADGVQDLIERCACGAARRRTVQANQDSETVKDYVFDIDPDPLPRCSG